MISLQRSKVYKSSLYSIMAISSSFLKKHGDFNKISALCLTRNVEDVETALNEAAGQPNQDDDQLSAIDTEQFTDDIKWTPLHYACQRQRSSSPIVELLLNRGFSCLAENIDGNTPLHIACITNNLEAAEKLLDSPDYQKCLEHKNKDGNTPLHIACRNNYITLAKAMLDKCSHDDRTQSCTCRLDLTNDQGETPIGLAIKNSHYSVAQLLLKHTPGNPVLSYPDLMPHVPTHGESTCAMECDPIELFVMGDHESGKSALITTLHTQSKGLLSRLYTLIPYIPIQTDSNRFGVVTTAVEYKHRYHCCPVVLHELSGNCSYAHEALEKYTENPLNAIYLVTVNLKKGPESVKDRLLFWLNYLRHKHSQFGVQQSITDRLSMKLKVIIVGTFYDQTRYNQRHMLNEICTSVTKEHEQLLSNFTWLGNYALNSKKAISLGIGQLQEVLHGQCQQLHQSEPSTLVPAQCYLLASLVLDAFSDSVVISASMILEHLEQSDEVLCKLLLNEDESADAADEIKKWCRELRYFSQFMIVEQDTEVFIVCDHNKLLSQIHNMFDELESLKHGIASSDSLMKSFESCGYPEGFILHFLESYCLCEPVTLSGLLALPQILRLSCHSVSESRVSPQPPKRFTHRRHHSSPLDVAEMSKAHNSTDRLSPDPPVRQTRPLPYDFIPTLLPSKPQGTIWEENGDKYPYCFAWSLVPRSDQECQYFTPKLANILLFRLFAAFTPPLQDSSDRMPLKRQCDLWDSGLSWSDPEGTRVFVVIHNYQSITVSMQCVPNQETTCLKLRNEIITSIQNSKSEQHLDIEMDELLIPHNEATPFPIYDPTTVCCYNKTEIENAIEERRPTITCTEGKQHITLEQLLFFEPFCFLTPNLQDKLFNADNANDKLDEDFCMTFGKELGKKWKILAKHFELHKSHISAFEQEQLSRTPHDVASRMLRHVRDSSEDGPHTYRKLRDSLLEISIFREREIRVATCTGDESSTDSDDVLVFPASV